jgi:hypothetical protein
MKSSLTLFLILTLCLLSLSLAKKKKSQNLNGSTPQAIGLKNHYGGPILGSKYGPQGDQYAQYVEANPETFMPMRYEGKKKIQEALKFKPYPGYEKKLKPDQLKSGDMTNIAPSASKIITPEIAVPKLNVQAEVHYPAVVALPTFTGMKKQFHDVTAYDKETGSVVHDKVLINAPQYKLEKTVMNIKHPHQETINLKTGERIKQNKDKKLHGQ